MNIDLMQILYTVIMIILAFFAAVVFTKTLSRYFKLDEKIEEDKDTSKDQEQDSK